MVWIAHRIEIYRDKSTDAAGVDGDCPQQLCWRTLFGDITQQFRFLSEAFVSIIRNRIFEMRLAWAQPAYYARVDP